MTQASAGEGIRLEYKGQNVGAITFGSPSGNSYRGGNNPTNRFVWATQEDADHLIKTGRFVLAPEPTEESEPTSPDDSLAKIDESLAPEPTEESEPKKRSNRKSEE